MAEQLINRRYELKLSTVRIIDDIHYNFKAKGIKVSKAEIVEKGIMLLKKEMEEK